MDVATAVFIAIALDWYFGEPKNAHPLIALGQIITRVEGFSLNLHCSKKVQKRSGIFALFFLLTLIGLPFYYLQKIIWLDFIIAPIILYYCIAANSLKQHSLDVFKALEQNDLKLARQKVAMIVSRDCSQMNALAVRRATIESVLENGADAIFSPIFWFLIGGSFGVILYRISNTLDAMWGYKNSRYLYFGWAAARLDDVLNYLPARLTAFSYALCGNFRLAWKSWRTQAKLLESPNGGVVMTSGAGSLNLQLGGTAIYHGKPKEKPVFGGNNLPDNKDIIKANRLINLALILWLLFLFFLIF